VALRTQTSHFNEIMRNLVGIHDKIVEKKTSWTQVPVHQNTFSKRLFLHAIDTKLNERYLHHWKENMFCDKNLINGNNLRTYRKIKESYNLEKYLLLDLDKNVIRNYTKIRISNDMYNAYKMNY
jgi:hypothetical protein